MQSLPKLLCAAREPLPQRSIDRISRSGDLGPSSETGNAAWVISWGDQAFQPLAPDERRGSEPVGLAFDDSDVAIDGQIGEALDEAAGLWPFNFEPVKFFVFA